MTTAVTADMRKLTEAIHETGKYLLLNNKKDRKSKRQKTVSK
ncbi:hypothetical protein [Paraflavitalea speifideaquila]|nr:hypothetical protein [Paraflavitalea speifideiaquila]